MGFTANLLISAPQLALELPLETPWRAHPSAQPGKLLLLIVVFGTAFAYCMTSLRHLGHFNVVVGADSRLIELYEGSAVDYLSGLINRASNRYTLAVRCLYSASPLFFWLFDSRLFVAVTALWALKFIGFQDFAFGFWRRGRPSASASSAIEAPRTSLDPGSSGVSPADAALRRQRHSRAED
jgi:hypothetical protein